MLFLGILGLDGFFGFLGFLSHSILPQRMLRYFHQLSGFLFYLLGLSLLTAVVLLKHDVGGMWPYWWLQSADLPFALVCVLYGGMSLYRSLKSGTKTSWILIVTIALPLILFFATLVVMNFWSVISPQ